MKIDFNDTNVHPTPNPKRLSVQRISLGMDKPESIRAQEEFGLIQNATVHPVALIQE